VTSKIRIGLLGLGTVGIGVYKLLKDNSNVEFKKIAVRQLDKNRSLDDVPQHLLTTDTHAVVTDPEIDLVIELIGGQELPYQLIQTALEHHKHVVTANKVVIAHHGQALFDLAKKQNKFLLFEAAVAGGIPVVLPLKLSLAGNHIENIAGILNGTTNYILTQMTENGLGFEQALAMAQEKGFAEADPTADVEGHDAACKIGILASIAYQQAIAQDQIYMQGITQIGSQDIEMAKTLGFVIKLIACASALPDGQIDIRVHPMLLPAQHPLAAIQNENNAIWIRGDAVGEVMFYGKGAGEMPTASAILGDVLTIVACLQANQDVISPLQFSFKHPAQILPIAETHSAFYVRIKTHDTPGVIGQLGKACGDHGVSLNSLMQKGTHSSTHTADIVLLTHRVKEAHFQAAMQAIEALPSTEKIYTLLRVFEG
jgi:homoserine dehydrogenase